MSNSNGAPEEKPKKPPRPFEDYYFFGSITAWKQTVLNAIVVNLDGNPVPFPEEGKASVNVTGQLPKWRDAKGAFELAKMYMQGSYLAFRHNGKEKRLELFRGDKVVKAWPTTQPVDPSDWWLREVAEARGLSPNLLALMFPTAQPENLPAPAGESGLSEETREEAGSQELQAGRQEAAEPAGKGRRSK